MAFATTPIHGKWALVYWLRPNGFEGSGLNDVTWGTGCTSGTSRDYVVEIDANDTADEFRWSVDGGSSWEASNVTITGAAQTLDNDQTIAFAATTGHTIGDRWHIGNLRSEPCDESGATAQITEATHRLLKPDSMRETDWSDSGGASVTRVDHTIGKAYFDADVGTAVTVTRNDGYVLEAELQELGYLQGWSINTALEMADGARMGQEWKEAYPGQASLTGSIEKIHIANESLFEAFEKIVDGTQHYFLLQLFTQEDSTNRDQTGDYIFIWVTYTSFGVTSSLADLIKENVNFQVHGFVSTWVAAT